MTAPHTPIATLVEKLSALRRKDKKLEVFGASSHHYELNRPMAERKLAKLESDHGVTLPDDYRTFLLEMGDGGAGPYYGVFPFGKWDGPGGNRLHSWVGKQYVVSSLSQPFPLSKKRDFAIEPEPRFKSEEEEDAWHAEQEKKLFPPELTRGWLPICHQGCALRNFLVVSGKERGHVWYDARAEDGPISPVTHGRKRVSFSGWYNHWLDGALKAIA